ncbi:hypothetical protein [Roseivirga sp. UBA838]|uniref:hypothetical protein n=1 Tax=Roseivirga sp. UBA838 TaxID=1947393 RepID=UPI0025810A3A|nr:hypothetical protein [Roseivirga sp. UBA838]|tara:strand:+ start:45997 stop:46674 length:678 start_codon:yes stop_codon:yes gene_type:complete
MIEDKLHSAWKAQNSDDLVLRIFKEVKHQKAERVIDRTKLNTWLFLFYNLVMLGWSTMVLWSQKQVIAVVMGAVLLWLLSGWVAFLNIKQLQGMYSLNVALPIAKYQKKIERLKLERIRHNRLIFYSCIVYFWSLIITLFQWDIANALVNTWQKSPLTVWAHVFLLVSWFPFAHWLLSKYDKPGNGVMWQKLAKQSFLTDLSINFSLNKVLNHLQELETFENNES